MNPGQPDGAAWASSRGEAGSLRLADASLIELVPRRTGPVGWVVRSWRRVRDAARIRVERVIDPDPLEHSSDQQEGRALIAALTLGARDPALDPAREAFTRLGLAHLMAISGFHLAVLAGAAAVAIRATGDWGSGESILVAALITAYLVVVPANAPVVRAGLMVLAFLAAGAMGRRHNRLAVLAWIACGLAIARPMDVFGLGYQLSIGLTGVLIWLMPTLGGGPGYAGVRGLTPTGTSRYPRLPARQPSPHRLVRSVMRSLLGWLVGAAIVTAVCWSVSLPLVAAHTGQIALVAVPVTLLVLPLIILLLWGGYVTIMLGVLVPAAGQWAAAVVGSIGQTTTDLVLWLDGLGWSWVSLPRVSTAWTAVSTGAVLIGWRWWAVRDRVAVTNARRTPGLSRPVHPGLIAALGAVSLGGWLGLEVRTAPGLDRDTLIRIDTLAVGDGSCHLIRSGSESMLFDCGSRSHRLIDRAVPRALRALGVGRVRTIVISHPNLDHFSGVVRAAEALGTERVLVGRSLADLASEDPEGSEAALLDALTEMGVETVVVEGGAAWEFGQARARVLSPTRGVRFDHVNDTSLVVALDVETERGARRVLMTGDVQRRAIAAIARSAGRADVIELPHHGSWSPAAAALVEDTDPAVVLQSTGPSRVGDMRWLGVMGTRTWRVTARDGASWAAIRRDGTVISGSMHAP